MEELLLSGIVTQSITDGPGLRMTLFTQGCPHRCKGCHNPDTWDFQGGERHTLSSLLETFDKNPLLKGMTYSGGEPLCQVKPLIPLTREIKKRGKDVICYTGYTFEELLERMEQDEDLKTLLYEMDYLVDGPFLLGERDLTLTFRGSKNQRFLDLPESLKQQKPVLFPV